MTERPHSFGDNEYPGAGLLKCLICGEPYREHRVGYPCPKSAVNIFRGVPRKAKPTK